MEANTNIPSALRHLLARGAQQTPPPPPQQPQHHHHHHQQQHTYYSGYESSGSHNTAYSASQSAATSATILQAAPASNKLTSAKSTGNLKSGGSTLGAWLSKYHLRPGGASGASGNRPQAPTGPSANTHGMGVTGSDPVSYSAFITSVETRESNGASGPGETRIGGLRMGRKRFLIYRIQITSSTGQWWIARRYSEFHELFQTLRRLFPQQSQQWAELFPSKRLIPGLSSSADSVQQRREKLNAFIRTVTQDPAVCQCAAMQQFLRADPIDEDSVPLAERSAAERETEKQRYMGIQPLQHPQQQSKRSISSGNVPPALDHSALYAQWQVPLPEKWQTIAAKAAPRTRESLDRMASMPSLKAAAAASRPQFDHSIPLPTPPQTAVKGYASVGPAAGGRTIVDSPSAAPIQMHRKISDPMEYASAEKRPKDNESSTMRKKYGLRRNLQFRNDKTSSAMKGVPSSADSLNPRFPQHPPDTAATLMQWDNDYVMVDEASDSNDMDIDRTLRGGSVDSDNEDSLRGGRRDALGNKRGRTLAVPRRTPLGGVGKNRRLPNDIPAVPSFKSQPLKTKRQHAATTTATTRAREDDTDDEQSDNDAVAPSPRTKSGPPKVSLDDFQLLSIIGKGSYGKVMLARYKDTGKVMAIKVISKSKLIGRPNEIRRVMSERKVLERTVEHPFLVGLQCAFQTKEKLFFCLDYVNGGELFFHLQRERRFGENRARFYAAEIASALAYLHSMDVVYRDLKPENCLLDARGHVRIVDFGLAKEVGPVVWRTEGTALYSVEEGGKTGTFCGTPEYLAPEVLLRQRYGKEVDWYCLGAVLYEMLTGLPPFYDQDNSKMYQRVLNETLRFPSALPPPAPCNGELNHGSGNLANNMIGRYAQDFVYRIMERDPQSRLGNGVFGTENVKRHVFFHGIDWGKIYRQEYAPPFVPKVSSIFDLSNIDPEFRNEPIPASILGEGQVDILAEAAEAERQAELAMQAQLMSFPSPVTSPAARRALADGNTNHGNLLLNNESLMAAMAAARRNAEVDAAADAFRGFSFVAPTVDSQDND
ncbi:Serine/threonine-protein kinase Sgk2 [Coemansia erecta]|uniref:Serine/threonine-protein kinase Sgk2 n=1 Tax=Coemansia erecta TaxID=147472 RepID=A0A9W8CT83_9FUNG|nr:Serine/threonine-protein kinase Sgk2 [Coemansia erecta]